MFKAEIDKQFEMTKDQPFFDLEGENRVQRNFNEVTYFVDVQYDFDDRFVRLCLKYGRVTVLAVFACTRCLYQVLVPGISGGQNRFLFEFLEN